MLNNIIEDMEIKHHLPSNTLSAGNIRIRVNRGNLNSLHRVTPSVIQTLEKELASLLTEFIIVNHTLTCQEGLYFINSAVSGIELVSKPEEL